MTQTLARPKFAHRRHQRTPAPVSARAVVEAGRADLQEAQLASGTLITASALLTGASTVHASTLPVAPSVPGQAQALAQYQATQALGLPAIPTNDGLVDPALVGYAVQRLSDRMTSPETLANLSPQDAQAVKKQFQDINAYAQQQLRSGQARAVSADQLAALGMSSNTMQALSLNGDSPMQAQGIFEDVAKVLAQALNLVFPGLGTMIENAVKAAEAIKDDLITIKNIINIFRDVQAYIDQLKNLLNVRSLVSMISDTGRQVLFEKYAGNVNVSSGLLPQVPGLKDAIHNIRAYGDAIKKLNWTTMFQKGGLDLFLSKDLTKERAGIEKWIDPSAVNNALYGVFTEVAATADENRSVGITAQSSEGQAGAEIVAEKAEAVFKKAKEDQATFLNDAVWLSSAEGLARETLTAVAQGNTINAHNGAVIAQAIASNTKAVDANRQALDQLVQYEIQRNRANAMKANLQNERKMNVAIERASNNALVTQITPVLAESTTIRGAYKLDLPEPH